MFLVDEILVDGNCVVETLLFNGANSAVASTRDVAVATSGLINECVGKKTPGEGGLAKQFGKVLVLKLV